MLFRSLNEPPTALWVRAPPAHWRPGMCQDIGERKSSSPAKSLFLSPLRFTPSFLISLSRPSLEHLPVAEENRPREEGRDEDLSWSPEWVPPPDPGSVCFWTSGVATRATQSPFQILTSCFLCGQDAMLPPQLRICRAPHPIHSPTDLQ